MSEDVREQWIAQLDEARRATLDAIAGIAPETIIYPGWTLKDFLAHQAGWQEAGITSLRAYVRGEEWQIPTFRGLNEYNLSSVETRKELRYEQVYTEWQMVHEALKAALREIPPEKLDGEMLLPWARRGPIRAVVEVLVEHEYEHLPDLQKVQAAQRPADDQA